MNGISQIVFFILLVTTLTLGAKNPDEGNPYEFGFTIDGEQHRHEKKDERGIIQGEFGFITADGIYHVTVYATDENGNFKILSMKNLRISAPLDGSAFKGEISPEANKYRKQANLAPLPPAQAAPAPNPLSLPAAPPSQQVLITPRPREPFKFTTQPTIKPACAGCGYVTTQKPKPGQSLFQFQKPFFQKEDQQNKPAQPFGSQDTQQPQTPNSAVPQNGASYYKPTSGPQNTNYKPFGGAQGTQNTQNLGGHGQNSQYPGEAEIENRFGGQNTQPGEGTQYPNGVANQIEYQNTQNLGGSGQNTQVPSGGGVDNQNQFGGQITQQGDGTLYIGGNANQNQIGGQNTQNLGGSGESNIGENVNNVGVNQPNNEIEAPFVSSQVGGSAVGGGSSVEGASPSYFSGNGGQGGTGNYAGNSQSSGSSFQTGGIGTPQSTGFGQGNLPSYPQLGIPEPNPLKLPGQGPTGAVSSLPPVSISDGFIHVGGDKKQDIPIKDKFPGMQDGLPEGIDEKDITNLLYKFHYTVGFHGHYEKGLKNGAKIGGYFVNGRDGISRIVTYIADENGYRPKVRFVNLGLESDETPKAETEKTFGLKDFEFVWYPI